MNLITKNVQYSSKFEIFGYPKVLFLNDFAIIRFFTLLKLYLFIINIKCGMRMK